MDTVHWDLKVLALLRLQEMETQIAVAKDAIDKAWDVAQRVMFQIQDSPSHQSQVEQWFLQQTDQLDSMIDDVRSRKYRVQRELTAMAMEAMASSHPGQQ